MSTHKHKILIVDDEKHLVKIYASIFRDEGFSVFTATDGKMALDRVVGHLPHCVLLDILMPESERVYDGFDVLQRMKESEKTCDIPVIMMTNLSADADVKKAESLGASSYIVKSDYTPVQVVDVVRKVLNIPLLRK